MTGKELKAFVAQVPDESVIEVRERSYGAWEAQFQLRATLVMVSEGEKGEVEP